MHTARLPHSPGAFLVAAGGRLLLLLLLLLPPGAGGQASASLDLDLGLDLGGVQQALGGELPASLCGTYATVANYSAVWAEPRMRAALQAAHAGDGDGGAALAALVDACGRAVGQLAASAALNARCGNLTAVAHDEAARNFSRGVVADRLVGGGPLPDAAADSATAAALRAPCGRFVGVAVLVSMGVGLL